MRHMRFGQSVQLGSSYHAVDDKRAITSVELSDQLNILL